MSRRSFPDKPVSSVCNLKYHRNFAAWCGELSVYFGMRAGDVTAALGWIAHERGLPWPEFVESVYSGRISKRELKKMCAGYVKTNAPE